MGANVRGYQTAAVIDPKMVFLDVAEAVWATIPFSEGAWGFEISMVDFGGLPLSFTIAMGVLWEGSTDS